MQSTKICKLLDRFKETCNKVSYQWIFEGSDEVKEGKSVRALKEQKALRSLNQILKFGNIGGEQIHQNTRIYKI